MILRTLLVLHLVLTTLELMRAQCAESPCSLLHSRSPFVPLSLTGLCVNLALQPLGDVVAGLVQLILGLLRAAAGFLFATAPILWKMYRASGEEFMIFIGGITGTVRAQSSSSSLLCCTHDALVQSTGLPGSWSSDGLRHSTVRPKNPNQRTRCKMNHPAGSPVSTNTALARRQPGNSSLCELSGKCCDLRLR